jgi:N-carbamoyl-L-amino-acid hydrolase
MLFVPSRGGISHSPHEHTLPEHCETGAAVLARALERLVTPTKEDPQ